ncbi:MAG: SDR family oxidoreductase [bacterium]
MSRSVLITGGSRGIGLATALRFAAAGDRVAILARPSPELDAAGRSVPALALPCDVRDVAAVDAAIAAIARAHGPVEVLVNNAGISPRHRVESHPLDAWDDVLAVNLRAPFLLARAVIAGMRAQGSGRIINVSSVHGRAGAPELAAYCASKAGLIGFTQALAEEVKADGIVVTALCPTSVDTRLLRGSGLAPETTAEEVAEAIFFLARAPAAIAGTALDMFG